MPKYPIATKCSSQNALSQKKFKNEWVFFEAVSWGNFAVPNKRIWFVYLPLRKSDEIVQREIRIQVEYRELLGHGT